MAGARSLTVSMWNVPTDETISQFDTFYENWLDKKQTRYQAFRNAQREALNHARKIHGSGHPYWWAGFVYIGDPGDLPVRKK